MIQAATSPSKPEALGATITSRRFERMAVFLIVMGLVSLILCILVMAAVPPVSRDALTHHLAVPKLWIAQGGMVEMPELIFSYYPMNLDLLYVIPLLLGNDILPKYIHFVFALATAWMIYAFLKPRTTRFLSLVGALMFLSTPVIVKLSTQVYVDLGLIFFSWASIVHLCQWGRSPQSTRHLIYSAIFCGLGLGTKYNGLIVFLLLFFFVAFVYIRNDHPDPVKPLSTIGYPLLFFVVAVTLFSPWMIRNFNLTGNPIYPLYSQHAKAGTDRTTVSNLSMKPWLQRKLIYKESALETASIPVRIFFQGKDDDPRLFDGKLNPALLFCPLLLLINRKKKDPALTRERLLMAAFAIFFLLYASFMVDMRIRYVAPIIPPLVVLSVLGMHHALLQIDQIQLKGVRIILYCVITGGIVFSLGLNAAYINGVFRAVDPAPYIAGEISRDDYITSKLPEYPAIQFANQVQNDQGRILALFLGQRLYYFDRPVEFGDGHFARMVKASSAENRLSRQLEKEGYTLCLIGIQHFETWVHRTFDETQKPIISQWLRDDCQWLYSKNGYVVLKLHQGNDGR